MTSVRRIETTFAPRADVEPKHYVPRHARVDDDVDATPSSPVRTLVPDQDLVGNTPTEAVTLPYSTVESPGRRTWLSRFSPKTEDRTWRIGGDTDVEVARQLANLGPEWRRLHAVPISDRRSTIDHVLMGPAGVFTVNTKQHPHANVWVRGDNVKVNGRNQTYIRASRHEARHAAALLSVRAGFPVEVHGIVAIMGAQRGMTVKEQPANLFVLGAKELVPFLWSLPMVLDEESVARIYAVARHLATWQPQFVEWTEF